MSTKNLVKPTRKFQISYITSFKPYRGFTLIELLIVVAIISILVAIGLASFTTAQRSARDSQRQADLGEVAGALGLYYGDNNSYPNTTVGQIDCPDGGIKLFGDIFDCGTPTLVYLTQLPNDPLCNPPCGAANYIFVSCNGEQSYSLYALLERPPNPPLPTATCGPVVNKNFWVNSR